VRAVDDVEDRGAIDDRSTSSWKRSPRACSSTKRATTPGREAASVSCRFIQSSAARARWKPGVSMRL